MAQFRGHRAARGDLSHPGPGPWRAAGTCDWTGAEGDGMYGLLCPAWPIRRVIVERAHQTLIGKIGETGAPFAVGGYHEFTASADGTLYLAMNEHFGGVHDNAGSVKVTVSLKEPPRPLAKAPVAAPRPFPRPAPAAAKTRFPARPIAVRFAKVPPRPDDVAVIIGNADYAKQGKDIPDVVPAYADAAGFKRYVIDAQGVREGNIIDLSDTTGAQMVSVFGSADNPRGQLYDWVRPGRSRVHVYYSGHGAPGGADGGAYLVPADADGARIELNGYPLGDALSQPGRPAGGLGHGDPGGLLLGRQPGWHGDLERLRRFNLKAEVPPVPPRVTVIAAGAANQIASWEKDKSHGLFTKYFLKGMSGEADAGPYGNGDGRVESKELDAYLKETLTYYARRYYGRDQTGADRGWRGALTPVGAQRCPYQVPPPWAWPSGAQVPVNAAKSPLELDRKRARAVIVAPAEDALAAAGGDEVADGALGLALGFEDGVGAAQFSALDLEARHHPVRLRPDGVGHMAPVGGGDAGVPQVLDQRGMDVGPAQGLVVDAKPWPPRDLAGDAQAGAGAKTGQDRAFGGRAGRAGWRS